VICLTVTGTKDFSVIISEYLPDLHLIGDTQCFPLKLYEPTLDVEQSIVEKIQVDLFGDNEHVSLFSGSVIQNNDTKILDASSYQSKDGITDTGLIHFQSAYPTETITKEDLFYYIYGLLHSEDYKSRYADNLSKELPRIPCVKQAEDFWVFSKAGRDLAELHINYETVTPYPVTIDCGDGDFDKLSTADFYVTQMKFIKKGEKSTVIYNHRITLRDIPIEAYDYVVNGKPALEWVMERQSVTTHKDSGIKNDANDWAIETMGNARYPLELFQRVITVSLETMKIVTALPKLNIATNKE
jgi:predicted helicase